jgi:GH18 family chitinase
MWRKAGTNAAVSWRRFQRQSFNLAEIDWQTLTEPNMGFILIFPIGSLCANNAFVPPIGLFLG